MDKQKQIEEMAKLIKPIVVSSSLYCEGSDNQRQRAKEEVKKQSLRNAEALYNAGCRKIPENAVVLTREEYERLLKEETLCERLGNDIDVKLKYIYELEDKVAQARKETAEKFAENAKMKLKDKLHKGKSLHAHVLGKEYVQRIFKEVIDETCKEFTEGKI